MQEKKRKAQAKKLEYFKEQILALNAMQKNIIQQLKKYHDETK